MEIPPERGGLSTVCTTQKDWEGPPDTGQGGEARTRWHMVGSAQMRRKAVSPRWSWRAGDVPQALPFLLLPTQRKRCEGTGPMAAFLPLPSSAAGLRNLDLPCMPGAIPRKSFYCWWRFFGVEGLVPWGIRWELRAAELFWYPDASSSYQPSTCSHGGVTALSTSYTPVQASSPQTAGKGACCAAALSVEPRGLWAVMELAACSRWGWRCNTVNSLFIHAGTSSFPWEKPDVLTNYQCSSSRISHGISQLCVLAICMSLQWTLGCFGNQVWTAKMSKQVSALFPPLASTLQVSWRLCTVKGLPPAGNPRLCSQVCPPTPQTSLAWSELLSLWRSCQSQRWFGSQNVHSQNSTAIAFQKYTSIFVLTYSGACSGALLPSPSSAGRSGACSPLFSLSLETRRGKEKLMPITFKQFRSEHQQREVESCSALSAAAWGTESRQSQCSSQPGKKPQREDRGGSDDPQTGCTFRTLDCNSTDLASLLELWNRSPVMALVSNQTLQLAKVKLTGFYPSSSFPSWEWSPV